MSVLSFQRVSLSGLLRPLWLNFFSPVYENPFPDAARCHGTHGRRAIETNYEIYAIRYATIPGFPVSELVAGAAPERKLDLAMMIWLIRGNGRNILVDSGFYHDRFFKTGM